MTLALHPSRELEMFFDTLYLQCSSTKIYPNTLAGYAMRETDIRALKTHDLVIGLGAIIFMLAAEDRHSQPKGDITSSSIVSLQIYRK